MNHLDSAPDEGFDLEFVPSVPEYLRDDVEALFFFNPRQSLLIDKIRSTVHEHGTPEILNRDGHIWIGIPQKEMQCLFALDRSTVGGGLVAVVLYLRTTLDCLSIVHLAVNEDYVNTGGTAVGVRMIEQIRRIGRRINGVTRIELPYKPGAFLPVQR